MGGELFSWHENSNHNKRHPQNLGFLSRDSGSAKSQKVFAQSQAQNSGKLSCKSLQINHLGGGRGSPA